MDSLADRFRGLDHLPVRVNRIGPAMPPTSPIIPQQQTSFECGGMAVSCQYRKWPVLLDHLVGASEQRWRNLKAERLRSLKVDDELEFGGLLDREVRW